MGSTAPFTHEPHSSPELLYRVEQSRGYDARGTLWSAGFFELELGVAPSHYEAGAGPAVQRRRERPAQADVTAADPRGAPREHETVEL